MFIKFGISAHMRITPCQSADNMSDKWHTYAGTQIPGNRAMTVATSDLDNSSQEQM